MGFERRGSSKYFYYKQRSGRTVTSVYCGNEELAARVAEELSARKRQREVLRRVREEEAEIDRRIRAVSDVIRLCSRIVLLTNGYHSHRGQWRKIREQDS